MATRNLLRALIAMVMSMFLCNGSGVSQPASRSLYLVSAFPTPKRPFGFPTTIYEINAQLRLQPVLEITDSNKGSDALLMDYDHHQLLVSYPYLTPNTLAFVQFDAPTHTSQFSYEEKSPILSSHLTERSVGIGPQFSLLLWDSKAKSEVLRSVDLASGTWSSNDWGNFSHVQVSGTAGVGQQWDDTVELKVESDGSAAPRLVAAAATPIVMHLPTDFKPSTNAITFLNANNNELALVSSSDEQFSASSGVGYQICHVLNKRNNTWEMLRVPGSVSWPRAFGDWLAFVVGESPSKQESPGRQARSMTPLVSGVSVNDLFNHDEFFPGTLFIHNARTKQSYTIDTHQGDSEVLLIEDNYVFYRINFSIYKAHLDEDGTVKPAMLIASDPKLSQVHWAFLDAQ